MATSTSRTELDEFCEPTTSTTVRLAGDLLDRGLPVLRGITDVVAGRVDQQREPLAERGDRLQGLVDRQRRLGQPGDLGRVAHLGPRAVSRAVHQADVFGRLPGGADHFLVSLVPDEQDVVVLRREPARLVVHLGHQWARRVDRAQVAALRFLPHLRRDSVGGEHDHRALGNLGGFLDEDRRRASRGPRPRGCCARSACARRPAPRTARAPPQRPGRPGPPRRSSPAAWQAGHVARTAGRQPLPVRLR